MAEDPANSEPGADKPQQVEEDTDAPTLSKNQMKKQARKLARKETYDCPCVRSCL